MIALLLAAALEGAPAPAPASEAAPAAPTSVVAQATGEKAKEDPLVCKSETVPNSRLRKRVCLPRSQRAARAENHQAAWAAMQSRPVVSIERGN